MTFNELVAHVALENHITKAAAERAIRSTFSAIKEYVLDGGRVVLPGFGSFKQRHMRATGKIGSKLWDTEARVTVAYRPSKKAKDLAS